MLWRSFLILLFLLPVSCDKYKDQPELKLARQFMDSYYVFANQREAIKFTSGLAQQNLKSEIELLTNVSSHQDAYRSRDIYFELKKEKMEKTMAIFLFELQIKIPDVEEYTKHVTLVVDRKRLKVKDFKTLSTGETF